MRTGKMKKHLMLVLCIVFLIGICAVNQTSAGFRELGLTARSVGMGRAFVAVANDPTAIFYNPAGLVHSNSMGLSTTYGRLFPGINDGGIHLANMAFVLPLGDVLTFGAAATNLNVPSYSENIFYGSVARRLPFNFALGFNLKILRWSAQGYYDPETTIRDSDFSKTNFSFDTGIMYESPELNQTFLGKFIKSGKIQAGLHVADLLQPSIAENGSEDGKLPLTIDGGVAYLNKSLTIASSIQHRNEITSFRLGGEFEVLSVLSSNWTTVLMLRGGGSRMLSEHDGGEVDVGFGLYVRGIAIDYAYLYPMELKDVGGSHRFTLSYIF